MMATVPLPPWLRRIQQSWYWQNAAMPIGVGLLGTMVLQGCLTDVFSISFGCIKGAINGCILTLITSFVKGHSAGSSDFRSDGTAIPAAPALKAAADAAVVLQEKASDPASPVTQDTATQARAAVQQIEATVTGTSEAVVRAAGQTRSRE